MNKYSIPDELIETYYRLPNMSHEELAFEFLRRNPYFIEVFIYFEDKLENVQVYLKNNGGIENIKNVKNIESTSIENEHFIKLIKKNMSNIFAYNGFDMLKDVDNVYSSFSKYSIEELLKESIEEKKKEYKTDFEINIDNESDILKYISSKEKLNELINRYAYYDNRKFKAFETIDIDIFLGKTSYRWLKFLQPSISFTINPFKNTSELRANFSKSLTKIKDELYMYLPSPFMIFNDEESSTKLDYRTSTLQDENLIIGIFLFDMIEIFKFTEAEIIEIAEIIFKIPKIKIYKKLKYIKN